MDPETFGALGPGDGNTEEGEGLVRRCFAAEGLALGGEEGGDVSEAAGDDCGRDLAVVPAVVLDGLNVVAVVL